MNTAFVCSLLISWEGVAQLKTQDSETYTQPESRDNDDL